MAQSFARTLNHTIEVDDVLDVQVTDAVDDGTSTGTFVREIRIFGSPNGNSAPATLIVRIKSQSKDNIGVTTPLLTF